MTHFSTASRLQESPSLEQDVMAMLEVDASDALPSWLGGRITAHAPHVRCRVMQVHPVNAARVKAGGSTERFCLSDAGAHAGPSQPAQRDPLMVEALHARQPREESIPGRGSRYLAVMHVMEEARYVIEISSPAPLAAHPRIRELATIGQAYFARLAILETDALTKLRNRRVFHAHVDAGIRGWTRSGRAHCIAMLDIDHFKRVNDEFGHLYGDEILVHFANLMRRTFRAGDMLYRFGGEEFVVVYSTQDDASAETALERFRAAVACYPFPGIGRITVSIGYAPIREAATPAAILVDRADQAVYVAKGMGRNRVCGWEPLIAAGVLQHKVPGSKDVTLF